MTIKTRPSIHNYCKGESESELVIVSAGFEDRAFEFISRTEFSANANCILIKFKYDIEGNDEVYKKYTDTIKKKFSPNRIFEVELDQNLPQEFEVNIKEVLKVILPFNGGIWLDISGLPTYAICGLLRISRKFYSNKEQVVVYTSAKEYFPTFVEYEKLINCQADGVEFLPPTMAKEMSEVLILEGFSGHRSKEGVSCLAVFAGYDVHRSAGVIESINPSTLLMLYGRPGDDGIDWRLNLSKDLHTRFESARKSASETVSTLDLQEAIDTLELYYDYLFEDYDFTISPVCSKMQTVAIYLFWEKYKEVQIVFPMPLGYSTDRKPTGVSHTYLTVLHPSNSLYKNINLSKSTS